jgi:hypothetical protein
MAVPDDAATGPQVEDRQDSDQRSKALVAFPLEGHMKLRPAATERDWMNDTPDRFARRCLPLLMANSSGWELLCPTPVTVTWSGNNSTSSMQIEPATAGISSHFGNGILTFNIPYLFRTPPGVNLLVRGPANSPKDGLSPLEGLVETDWTPASFTMNWKFTRATSTRFEQDEPIAMLVPQERGDLESYAVYTVPLSSEPELDAAFRHWSASRTHLLEHHLTPGSWQKDYMLGRGATPGQHQRRRHLTTQTDSPHWTGG